MDEQDLTLPEGLAIKVDEIVRISVVVKTQAEALRRARVALSEIARYNNVRNDLDAYLSDLADWGMGEREQRPDPKQYGLKLPPLATRGD